VKDGLMVKHLAISFMLEGRVILLPLVKVVQYIQNALKNLAKVTNVLGF